MSKRGKIDINGIGAPKSTSAADQTSAANQTLRTDSSDPAPEPTASTEKPSPTNRDTGSRDTGSRDRYDPPPRRPKSERENAFSLGGWLLEGVLGVAEEVQHNDLGLPEEFWKHAYTARKETLLAVRALVDATLEQWEEEGAEREATRSGRSKRTKKSGRKQRGSVNIDFK